MDKLRIAIIGAGPCGLSQLLAFKRAEQEQQVELVCFERQSDWGGLWIYTSQIGLDAHGEPVHSSMYRQPLPRAEHDRYRWCRSVSGRVLHSHEFRGADEFTGLNLLVIGGALTAEDIALQCYKFGAQSIAVSSRQILTEYIWPETIKSVPMLVRMEGRTAHFNDSSTIDNIDAIIFCTGYRHSYPFMTRKLRLNCGVTDFVARSLYKSIFWIDQPSLAYLGTPRQLYTFPMFDAQAALVRDVFLGNVHLIDQSQWQADINAWRTREEALSPTDIPAWIDFQTDYIRDILTLLSPEHDDQSLLKFDIDQRKDLFKKFLTDKYAINLLEYRNQSFPSVIDSKKQTTLPTYKPWIENMDDSMEKFLNNYKRT